MMMMPAWYERMNQRERVLAMIVAGGLFIVVNIFIWSWLLNAIGRSRGELTTRQEARKQQTVYATERGLWTKRADWIQQHQPILRDPSEASKLLEEQLRPVADKYKILLENPQIGAGESTPNHQTVFATFDTKSEWRPLIQFLYEIQQPEAFVVFESVNLSVDSNEPSMMRGRFKIARWFAPVQTKG